MLWTLVCTTGLPPTIPSVAHLGLLSGDSQTIYSVLFKETKITCDTYELAAKHSCYFVETGETEIPKQPPKKLKYEIKELTKLGLYIG